MVEDDQIVVVRITQEVSLRIPCFQDFESFSCELQKKAADTYLIIIGVVGQCVVGTGECSIVFSKISVII
jgi:hypothetical protein